MAVILLLVCIIRFLKHWYRRHVNYPRVFFTPRKTTQLSPSDQPLNKSAKIQPKPEWVVKEVLRLEALLPDAGCRTIATTFNRIHHEKSGMTVSKSYCANQIKKHLYDIQVIRRKLKRKNPKPLAKNIIWATDLTTVTDTHKSQHKVIGIVDHGSRSGLSLQHLPTATSITILRALFNAIELYGKPKYLRTDNERIFTSRLFRFSLRLLGIKHQRSMVCCPWQNGRVERFFGTFKERINQVVIESAEQLTAALPEYRFWYNHIRPHDNLAGFTPAEYWNDKAHHLRNEPALFYELEVVLASYYFLP